MDIDDLEDAIHEKRFLSGCAGAGEVQDAEHKKHKCEFRKRSRTVHGMLLWPAVMESRGLRLAGQAPGHHAAGAAPSGARLHRQLLRAGLEPTVVEGEIGRASC